MELENAVRDGKRVFAFVAVSIKGNSGLLRTHIHPLTDYNKTSRGLFSNNFRLQKGEKDATKSNF